MKKAKKVLILRRKRIIKESGKTLKLYFNAAPAYLEANGGLYEAYVYV